MNTIDFICAGRRLTMLGSGALWDAEEGVLCVSDLHLGKSDRIARRSGVMLPPYEVQATLDRLSDDLAATAPDTVICLGDSFDDIAAADSLTEAARGHLLQMQAGRRWIWIEGNHDPGPVDLGGTHLASCRFGGLTYRHIAGPDPAGEVSGHYHPKLGLKGAGPARPALLHDRRRIILPAYGAYTGGLRSGDPALQHLFTDPAFAILTGRRPVRAPLRQPG